MSFDIFNLSGRIAVVTGGASGLSRQIARTLAGAGAKVAIADINIDGAARTAEDIVKSGGHASAFQIDVSDHVNVAAVISAIHEDMGGLDIAVNAAGVSDGAPDDTTPEQIWRRVIGIDLSGVYYCCMAQARHMIARKRGSIINMASMSAGIVNRFPPEYVPETRQTAIPAYCAAKAGVRQLTRALAAFWARHNVRVNCISPGYMATEMTRGIFEMPELVDGIRRDTPLERIGVPQDLDGLALYLSSDASSFMTGTDIVIDGGYTIW
ncbi:MAG: SDR family oxidoreductase [Candidatus Sumerlaeota bacterium]|nr:SDR family oxidoreductase [Candidatus Sumerlaeota bacterium]